MRSVTDEVSLRGWRVADAPRLVAAWHDPAIIVGSSPPDDRSITSATRWIEGVGVREQRLLAVDRVIDVAGECVGEVGLSEIDQHRGAAMVGWWVADRHRGRGYAVAGLRAMVDLAPSFGVDVLVAQIAIANLASVAVAERAGFGLLRVGSAEQPHVYVHR